MKKYILTLKGCITTDGEYSQFDNMVYEFVQYNEYNCQAIVLKLITYTEDGRTFFEKGSPIAISNKHKTIDVTNVYNKINQFCRKLAHYDEHDEWTKIDNIRENFENGKYPTKSEFYYMNKLWNKLK